MQIFPIKPNKSNLGRIFNPEIIGQAEAIHAAIWLNSRFIFRRVAVAYFERMQS